MVKAVHPLVKVVHPLVKAMGHPWRKALMASKNMERMVKVVHPLMAGENTERTILSYYKRGLR